MIVILGAGLAGLSVAHYLKGTPHLVLERESTVGGLARSVDEGGFLFDFTGHLLHIKSDSVRELCDELLGDDQVHLDRSAWIQYRDTLVRYPFQVNIAALPVDVKVECVTKFAESMLPENRLPPGDFQEPADTLPLGFLNVREPTGGYTASFAEWTVRTFGEGFAKHFFLTYNAKNFACDLETITAEWVSWAVPKPSLHDVLEGALGLSEQEFGYNPRFRYPKSGGIRKLPDAMARGLHTVRVGSPIHAIDARARRVTLEDGTTHDYTHLVATNPLPELVRMLGDAAGDDVREAASALRHCAVSSFNFGLDGPLGHDRHWIYYPEEDLRFYRVGFPSNLTPSMAPDGNSSVCAEVAYPSDRFPPDEGEEQQVLDDLVRCGAIDDPARVVLKKRLDLPYAYVLFDDARRRALPVIFRALLDLGIVPLGRYGAWDYLSMEQTILQGQETAEYLRSR